MDNLSAIATAKEEGEHKKAIETAKKMLADGLSIDMVAKYTGLSIYEVKELNGHIPIY